MLTSKINLLSERLNFYPIVSGGGNYHRQEVEGEEERAEDEGEDPLTPGEVLEVLHCQPGEEYSHGEEGQADDQPSPDLVAVVMKLT